jgi:hypothetical protein
LASLTCVFYLRHSSNWNPHRLHSEPFLFFPPKERHNVGLLRFDDDHDHICYRLRRFKYLAEKVMSSNHYNLLYFLLTVTVVFIFHCCILITNTYIRRLFRILIIINGSQLSVMYSIMFCKVIMCHA